MSQRVEQLLRSGLIAADGTGSSTGGRAPQRWRFRVEAGYVLAAEFGATSLSVGLCDLSGRVLASHDKDLDIDAGPEHGLARLEEIFDEQLRHTPSAEGALWGIGLGLSGPVEFSTARPVAPPIMPGYGMDTRYASGYCSDEV